MYTIFLSIIFQNTWKTKISIKLTFCRSLNKRAFRLTSCRSWFVFFFFRSFLSSNDLFDALHAAALGSICSFTLLKPSPELSYVYQSKSCSIFRFIDSKNLTLKTHREILPRWRFWTTFTHKIFFGWFRCIWMCQKLTLITVICKWMHFIL